MPSSFAERIATLETQIEMLTIDLREKHQSNIRSIAGLQREVRRHSHMFYVASGVLTGVLSTIGVILKYRLDAIFNLLASK